MSSTNDGRAIKGVGGDGNKVDNVAIINTNKTAKFKNLIKVGAGFLTLRAKLTFIQLRQVFTKAPILHYFDSEYHI